MAAPGAFRSGLAHASADSPGVLGALSAAAPLAAYASLWTLALEGLATFGSFPVRETYRFASGAIERLGYDPKTLALYPLPPVLLSLAALTTVAWLGLRATGGRVRAPGATWLVAGWALIAVQLFADPFGLVAWYLD